MTVGNDRTELVLTAPDPFGPTLAYRVRCRSTLGVLTELILDARSHIIIAAPFMQPGHGLSAGPLTDALRSALRRRVDVDVLGTASGLDTIDRARLSDGSAGQLRFFKPAIHIADDRKLGSHAKFCSADAQKAYVGSANLTAPGLTGQLELGVLISGTVARQIEEFWNYCIELGILVRVH